MTAAEEAARRLVNTVRNAGATMTISSGGKSVTIGPEDQEGGHMSTVFADQETGEIRDVKNAAVDGATALLEAVWKETGDAYNIGALASLQVAQKITNAVLAGAVKEHFDILAEPMKPRQR